MKWCVYIGLLIISLNVSASNTDTPADSKVYVITQDDITSICQLFTRAGGYFPGERIGADIFGSIENFWENVHRLECPPHYPNPVFIQFERHMSARRETLNLLTRLEGVSEENRLKVLNRPRSGMRRETILDSVERTQRLMRDRQRPNDSFLRIIDRYIERLRAMGAKRLSELDQ